MSLGEKRNITLQKEKAVCMILLRRYRHFKMKNPFRTESKVIFRNMLKRNFLYKNT